MWYRMPKENRTAVQYHRFGWRLCRGELQGNLKTLAYGALRHPTMAS